MCDGRRCFGRPGVGHRIIDFQTIQIGGAADTVPADRVNLAVDGGSTQSVARSQRHRCKRRPGIQHRVITQQRVPIAAAAGITADDIYHPVENCYAGILAQVVAGIGWQRCAGSPCVGCRIIDADSCRGETGDRVELTAHKCAAQTITGGWNRGFGGPSAARANRCSSHIDGLCHLSCRAETAIARLIGSNGAGTHSNTGDGAAADGTDTHCRAAETHSQAGGCGCARRSGATHGKRGWREADRANGLAGQRRYARPAQVNNIGAACCITGDRYSTSSSTRRCRRKGHADRAVRARCHSGSACRGSGIVTARGDAADVE